MFSVDSTSVRARVLDSPWAIGLPPELRRRVHDETIIRRLDPHAFLCRRGQRPSHWIGVIDGLVRVSTDTEDGRVLSFIGVPAGGWFGEGSILKNEALRYDVVALRQSVVALLPKTTFDLLLEVNVGFNKFLLTQLNERLGQFIAMTEYRGLLRKEGLVAHQLAGLMNPLLYPGNKGALQISQVELAYLMGLSRQSVNAALKSLEQDDIIAITYRGITVKDMDRLRRIGRG